VNTGVAIPNTTEEVRNRIMLDPEMIGQPSLVCGDGGGVWISYCPDVEHLLGKISNRDLEFCVVGSSCDKKRLGIRSGVVTGLMTGGEVSWREYGDWLIRVWRFSDPGVVGGNWVACKGYRMLERIEGTIVCGCVFGVTDDVFN
jgi:hypothetical protein